MRCHVLGKATHARRLHWFGRVQEADSSLAEVPLLRRKHPLVGRADEPGPNNARYTQADLLPRSRQSFTKFTEASSWRLVQPRREPAFIPSLPRKAQQPFQNLAGSTAGGSFTLWAPPVGAVTAINPCEGFLSSKRLQMPELPMFVLRPQNAGVVRGAGHCFIPLRKSTVSLQPQLLDPGRGLGCGDLGRRPQVLRDGFARHSGNPSSSRNAAPSYSGSMPGASCGGLA
jgi:hypothetical protein